MSAIDAAAVPEDLQRDLLVWYDAHARALPWRVPPGSSAEPDPYRVWLSEIMLQQTVVTAVIDHFETFTTRWPTVQALAAAPDADVLAAWAGLGYYARARNLIACARAVNEWGGFPDSEEALRALPGIGAYTAAAIAAIAFARPAVVVDGNIERVMARLFAVETPLPAAKPILRSHAEALTPARRPGDHAQALMDLGATICRPRAAACLACPVQRYCAASGDRPERLPTKAAKAKKPERGGIAYWLTHGDRVLVIRRPAKGLLGGMAALPASEFTARPVTPPTGSPLAADWHLLDAQVTHVFTHFRLTLRLATADISDRPRPAGDWKPIDGIEAAGFPTLFVKAARAFLKEPRS